MIARKARIQGSVSETRLRIIQIDKDLSKQIASELREAQTKIAELKEKKLVMSSRLARTKIHAPRSGTVHQLNVHTIGGVIKAGEPIMVIVPKQDRLIFEARVRPSDIDQVQMGCKTIIRLNAFDPGFTPELIGKITVISPDSITDLETKMQYYLVRIDVAKDELVKLGKHKLVPGMLAEAFIQTQSRTVLQYLSKPLSDRLAHVFRER
jgi:HlyD family secretion protein